MLSCNKSSSNNVLDLELLPDVDLQGIAWGGEDYDLGSIPTIALAGSFPFLEIAEKTKNPLLHDHAKEEVLEHVHVWLVINHNDDSAVKLVMAQVGRAGCHPEEQAHDDNSHAGASWVIGKGGQYREEGEGRPHQGARKVCYLLYKWLIIQNLYNINQLFLIQHYTTLFQVSQPQPGGGQQRKHHLHHASWGDKTLQCSSISDSRFTNQEIREGEFSLNLLLCDSFLLGMVCLGWSSELPLLRMILYIVYYRPNMWRLRDTFIDLMLSYKKEGYNDPILLLTYEILKEKVESETF